MSEPINIYCEESCHLEHDRQPLMVLGAVWCPTDKTTEMAKRLLELKAKHRMSERYELKWTTVSKGREAYFQDVLDYFFDDGDLHFRALIAAKDGLRHGDHGQTHDEWYYKMLFEMLKALLDPEKRFLFYFDYKDTHGSRRITKLHEVLSNSLYDFSREIVERVQLIEIATRRRCMSFSGRLHHVRAAVPGQAGGVETASGDSGQGSDLLALYLGRKSRGGPFAGHAPVRAHPLAASVH